MSSPPRNATRLLEKIGRFFHFRQGQKANARLRGIGLRSAIYATTIDSGFICCWLDVKRIARSKPPPTTNGYCWRATRIGSGLWDTIHVSSTREHARVYVRTLLYTFLYVYYSDAVYSREIATWSDDFLSCRDRVTLRSVMRPTYQAPQPVCYVRRGNLLLPGWELVFRTERFSFASRWEALLSLIRIVKLRSTNVVVSIDLTSTNYLVSYLIFSASLFWSLFFFFFFFNSLRSLRTVVKAQKKNVKILIILKKKMMPASCFSFWFKLTQVTINFKLIKKIFYEIHIYIYIYRHFKCKYIEETDNQLYGLNS